MCRPGLAWSHGYGLALSSSGLTISKPELFSRLQAGSGPAQAQATAHSLKSKKHVQTICWGIVFTQLTTTLISVSLKIISMCIIKERLSVNLNFIEKWGQEHNLIGLILIKVLSTYLIAHKLIWTVVVAILLRIVVSDCKFKKWSTNMHSPPLNIWPKHAQSWKTGGTWWALA